MRDGPEAALALLDELTDEERLRGATPADLLQRLGRLAEAAAAYRRALDLAGTEPERAHLRRRIGETESPAPNGPNRAMDP